ncbi:hypothetical protein HRR83_000361 [Exophiala dermatitidis]|uniref:Uncharacterized protein n=1 Tax=Exophiala dermatitidis TaxID=5970 RepID=A0AAN6F184_EXODE|nr:hypothetical protein HRR75_000326 [Exophiala dermatitidis]KAJ4527609.1 hypothetical protein HRR74_000363 [Exophiala dermatitidis]KAJ4528245.1 hypothetical protein HRR73_000867 [Exophiala dermatitidis]KAJ4531185.1 hypothetical protein HRR76_008859 [Exophiala dermatitidis]KAJ4536192.1 hypothetical protein HRR78_008631 [Exophiala dermatitidis]
MATVMMRLESLWEEIRQKLPTNGALLIAAKKAFYDVWDFLCIALNDAKLAYLEFSQIVHKMVEHEIGMENFFIWLPILLGLMSFALMRPARPARTA